MIGVILAAGDGTRLEMSTGQKICKPLRKINNKHLLEYSLDNLIELGATKAYIVVGKQGSLIKDAFGDEYKGLNLCYVYQKEQKGLMNAFLKERWISLFVSPYFFCFGGFSLLSPCLFALNLAVR